MMADINLIGNDAAGSERGGRREEQPGSNDFGQDNFESGYSGNYSDSEFEKQGSFMEQSYIKKSSKSIMYVLIGACMILFGLLIYLLVSDDEKEPAKVATTVVPEKVIPPTTTPEAVPAVGPNDPVLQNIDVLLASIPQNLKLSVLRYSQGEFIIESQSKTDASIDELNNRLKQTLTNGRIRETNKARNNATGVQIGTIAGFVPHKDVWADATEIPGINYIGEGELKTRIENYCKQENLKLKEYHKGRTKTENKFRKTMIKIKVMGSRSSATRFLKALNDDKISVNFSKVVFIAAEQSMNSDVVNLIVEIELLNKLA
jgi:hypothetical protein